MSYALQKIIYIMLVGKSWGTKHIYEDIYKWIKTTFIDKLNLPHYNYMIVLVGIIQSYIFGHTESTCVKLKLKPCLFYWTEKQLYLFKTERVPCLQEQDTQYT